MTAYLDRLSAFRVGSSCLKFWAKHSRAKIKGPGLVLAQEIDGGGVAKAEVDARGGGRLRLGFDAPVPANAGGQLGHGCGGPTRDIVAGAAGAGPGGFPAPARRPGRHRPRGPPHGPVQVLWVALTRSARSGGRRSGMPWRFLARQSIEGEVDRRVAGAGNTARRPKNITALRPPAPPAMPPPPISDKTAN